MPLRLTLRIVFVPLFICMLALWLIRTEPNDDRDLRQLLLPEGCPSPCFMGIRPGFTTIGEAMPLLRLNAWVEQATDNGNFASWSWSGQQPHFIDVTQPPRITYSRRVDGEIVIDEVTLPTHHPTGFILLMLNRPSMMMVTNRDGGKNISVWLRYADVVIKGSINCPAWIRDVSWMEATITYYDHNTANFDFEGQFWGNAPALMINGLLCP